MRFDPLVAVRIRDAYAARHEPEAVRLLGSVYWTFLLVLFACIVIGSASFGVWEFMRPLPQGATSSATLGGQKTFTRAELQKVLEGFDKRANEYEKRRVAPVDVKDPSR